MVIEQYRCNQRKIFSVTYVLPMNNLLESYKPCSTIQHSTKSFLADDSRSSTLIQELPTTIMEQKLNHAFDNNF